MVKVLTSIQGERQEERELTLWATDDEVAEFVEGANDRHLICRERGRHDWQAIRRTGLVFTGVTKDDYPERRLTCPDCQAAERVEVWDVKFYASGAKKGQVKSCVLLSSYTHYIDAAYQNKKHVGRMRPGQIRGAVGAMALTGQHFGASEYRAMIAEAKRARKDREAAVKRNQMKLVETA